MVAGASAVSVDAYCTRFLGLTPAHVAMITRSAALGLGEADPSKVKTREIRICSLRREPSGLPGRIAGVRRWRLACNR
ncbi:MAG: hypothetical protein MZV49_06815 [Rhodopseudomonas palustris]|nr:hypothetical protein [Rhodopseudomonas palustris]